MGSEAVMPDIPDECSHGPWYDEQEHCWYCIRYGMSVFVHESGDKWYFVEHVSDVIQRRLDSVTPDGDSDD